MGSKVIYSDSFRIEVRVRKVASIHIYIQVYIILYSVTLLSVTPILLTRAKRNMLLSRIHNNMRLLCLVLLCLLSVPALAQSSLECSICGDGQQVGSPDNIFRDPSTGADATCGELEERGQSGSYTDLQCVALQLSVYRTCECESVNGASPTDAPEEEEEEETSRPTASVSLLESDAPSFSPTLDPAQSSSSIGIPSFSPTISITPSQTDDDNIDHIYSVSGSVFVKLLSVVGAMSEATIQAYEQQATSFFADHLLQQSPPILQVAAILEQQTFQQRRRKLRQRRLQNTTESSLGPLETILQVSGKQRDTLIGEPGDGNESLDSLLLQTIQDNQELFIAYLHNVTSPSIQMYFQPVETVQAMDLGEVLPPTMSPTTDDNSAVSLDTIVFIAVGGAVFAIVVVGFIWYKQQVRRDQLVMTATASKSESQQGISEKSTTSPATDAKNNNTLSKSVDQAEGATTSSSLVESPQKSEHASPDDDIDAGKYHAQDDSTSARHDLQESTQEMNAQPDAPLSKATSPDSTLSDGKISRIIFAPAGRLGIVIDTTRNGPTVYKVHEQSPLYNKLKPGDIITSVDDVDTRAMSAASITSLMVKSVHLNRRLTVLTTDATEYVAS